MLTFVAPAEIIGVLLRPSLSKQSLPVSAAFFLGLAFSPPGIREEESPTDWAFLLERSYDDLLASSGGKWRFFAIAIGKWENEQSNTADRGQERRD
jgi:hypothetical protein